MSTKLNTVISCELEDGSTIELTLTYRALLQLKVNRAADYREYNRIMTKGVSDEFDNLRVIYVAYLCKMMLDNGNVDQAMTFDQFLDVAPLDRVYVATLISQLINPKKATASARRS